MLPLRDILLRLTVAAVLGAIIGIERDLRRRPAGMRTSLFVCLATALFTILSHEIAHLFGDTGSTRIASNIVQGDRKSTRLNSSHRCISYAVFCLKKKKKIKTNYN